MMQFLKYIFFHILEPFRTLILLNKFFFLQLIILILRSVLNNFANILSQNVSQFLNDYLNKKVFNRMMQHQLVMYKCSLRIKEPAGGVPLKGEKMQGFIKLTW